MLTFHDIRCHCEYATHTRQRYDDATTHILIRRILHYAYAYTIAIVYAIILARIVIAATSRYYRLPLPLRRHATPLL